jgi:hypothetical protein
MKLHRKKQLQKKVNLQTQQFPVNVKLGIVQVKLRFHGGTRGKKSVMELVSQVTERVLLVLCFD